MDAATAQHEHQLLSSQASPLPSDSPGDLFTYPRVHLGEKSLANVPIWMVVQENIHFSCPSSGKKAVSAICLYLASFLKTEMDTALIQTVSCPSQEISKKAPDTATRLPGK